jgi:hypothetical protein
LQEKVTLSPKVDSIEQQPLKEDSDLKDESLEERIEDDNTEFIS